MTDKNYKFIAELPVQGVAILPQGNSSVAFSCDVDSDDKPEVVVRYHTRSEGEFVILP